MDSLLFLLACWCFFAVVGYFIGVTKGNAGSGAVLGFLFGPIGWLIVALFKDKRKKCPHCGGTLGEGPVTRCKNCGQGLLRVSAHARAIDPLEAWEAKERAKVAPAVPGVPEHLRGRQVDE